MGGRWRFLCIPAIPPPAERRGKEDEKRRVIHCVTYITSTKTAVITREAHGY